MKTIFTYILILAAAVTATAQTKNTPLRGTRAPVELGTKGYLESIREEYREIQEIISLMSPDSEGFSAMPPSYYEVTKVQNLPATGMHRKVVRMYYGELPSEEEGDPYPPHYLRFVTSRYNYAAREFYEEYLFDDKGNLIFLYAITPDIYLDRLVHYELRLWLGTGITNPLEQNDAHGGTRAPVELGKGGPEIANPLERILRFTAKEAQGDEKYDGNLGTFNYKEVYSGTVIPDIYRDEVNLRLQRAKGFQTMFKGIDEN